MKKLFALILMMVGLCCSCDNNSRVSGVKYEHADDYQKGDFTYQANQIEGLEIDWVIGKVELIVSTAETLKVQESGKDLSDSKKLHYLWDQHTLKIQFWESEYQDKVLSKDKFITIEIPSSIDVKIVTVSADLIADELPCKSLEFCTTSGDAHISKLTASKTKMTSVSGDVFIGSMQANSVEIDTTSGDYQLTLTACDSLVMDSVSGDAGITLDHLGATITFSTVSGEYYGDGNVIGDGACKIHFDSVSGDLRIQ